MPPVSLLLQLLLLLLLFASAAAAGDCPKDCRCIGTSVHCANANLTRVPSGIPANATELDLSNNRIVSLDGLDGFQQLKALNLRGNFLSEWNNTWLNGSSSLQKLYLSQNRLTQPPQGLCDSAPKLTNLLLDANKLVNLTFTDDYGGCAELKVLKLAENALAELRNDSLAALAGSRLLSLSLSTTQLADADEGSLRHFADSLESLDVSQNPKLSEAAIGRLLAGATFEKLHSLMLRRSGLVRLSNSTLAGVPHLRTLRLDASNRLSDLQPGALGHLPQLQQLSLRGTNVSGWPPQLLRSAKLLEELDLGDVERLTTVGGRDGDVNPLPQLKRPKFRLLLAGAGIVCDCGLLWLTDSLAEDPTKLQEPNRTVCRLPQALSGRPLLQFRPDGCQNSTTTTAAPADNDERRTVMWIALLAAGCVASALAAAASVACVAARRSRRQQAPRLVLDDDCDPLVAPGQRPSIWIRLRHLLRHRRSQEQQQQRQREEAGRPPIFDPQSPEDYLSEDA